MSGHKHDPDYASKSEVKKALREIEAATIRHETQPANRLMVALFDPEDILRHPPASLTEANSSRPGIGLQGLLQHMWRVLGRGGMKPG